MMNKVGLLRLKVHAQLVDVRRDIAAPRVRGEGGLLEAEYGCGQGRDALALQLAAGLEAFPGGGDLDADAARGKVRGELLEVGNYSWED